MNRPYEPPRVTGPHNLDDLAARAGFTLSEATAAAEDDRLSANERRDLYLGLAALGVLLAAGAGVIALAVHGFRALASTVAHS